MNLIGIFSLINYGKLLGFAVKVIFLIIIFLISLLTVVLKTISLPK